MNAQAWLTISTGFAIIFFSPKTCIISSFPYWPSSYPKYMDFIIYEPMLNPKTEPLKVIWSVNGSVIIRPRAPNEQIVSRLRVVTEVVRRITDILPLIILSFVKIKLLSTNRRKIFDLARDFYFQNIFKWSPSSQGR